MDSGHEEKRMNVADDRLSSLPDELIHIILSFIDLKKAVETSVLSRRWRLIWASLPYIKFSVDFNNQTFVKFVTQFLSRRNNLAEVFSIKLRFGGDFSLMYIKQVMNDAFSHNIQRLDVVCYLIYDMCVPLSIFSSPSLKHFSLTKDMFRGPFRVFHLKKSLTLSSTWDLPALTKLHLECVTLNDANGISMISKCAKLKNLTLKLCEIEGNCLSISHPGLSDLAVENCRDGSTVVNVVAPRLKNLTVTSSSREEDQFMISAPELAFLRYKGYQPLQLSTDGFPSLDRADLCISRTYSQIGHKIVRLLQQVQSVKFLTLNLELVKTLSSSLELISNQSSPFSNLKRMKIYPENASPRKYLDDKVTMPTEVEKYLLASSPNATLIMISHKDITAMRNANSARKHMGELQALLEKYKASCESHNIKMHTQLETKKQCDIGGMMTQIDKYWKKLNEQMEQGKKNTSGIISILKAIEGLMTNLPESQTANLQTRFSSLCAEANLTMKKIIGHTKIQMN